jgi:ATP-dependent helicase HrpB
MAEGWARLAGAKGRGRIEPERAGAILALAYPDRIAKARPGQAGRYLLANGKGAELDPADPLARHEFLVVADLAGVGPTARIVLAAPIDAQAIEQDFAERIETVDEVRFDPATGSVRARRVARLGKVVLQESQSSKAAPEQVRAALLRGIADLGIARLPWTKDQQRLRQRVEFLRALEPDAWPDLSDEGLKDTLADWLGAFLDGKRSLAAIGADDLGNALATLLPWDRKRRLDEEAPSHFEAPTGSLVPIDYQAEGGPSVAVRVQELFGLAVHPTIGAGRAKLTLELLSPAHRPIQITRDLPGFWAGSWKDVRSDMRGRYPKHVWPDDPANATATRRAKPRGT